MTLYWKCVICKTMVPTIELKTHKKTNSHKSRLLLLDILETLKEKVFNNDYNDEEIEILLKTYMSNPFNMDMDIDMD
jgi:hypothetical protein